MTPRIADIAEDLHDQLIEKMKLKDFGSQLDEATAWLSSCTNLFVMSEFSIQKRKESSKNNILPKLADMLTR